MNFLVASILFLPLLLSTLSNHRVTSCFLCLSIFHPHQRFCCPLRRCYRNTCPFATLPWNQCIWTVLSPF